MRHFLHPFTLGSFRHNDDGYTQLHTLTSPLFPSIRVFQRRLSARSGYCWQTIRRNKWPCVVKGAGWDSNHANRPPECCQRYEWELQLSAAIGVPCPQPFSFRSSRDFTSGHSESITLKYTVCRIRPVDVIMWLRKIPSSFAPIRKIAARDLSFKESVFSSTRMQPSVSNACLSSKYFASVFAAVRCHSRPIHVLPISTR